MIIREPETNSDYTNESESKSSEIIYQKTRFKMLKNRNYLLLKMSKIIMQQNMADLLKANEAYIELGKFTHKKYPFCSIFFLQ
jgi:hypothetical protein